MINQRCQRCSSWISFFFIVTIAISACAGPSQYEKEKKAESIRTIGEAYMRQRNFTAALAELLKAQELAPNDHVLQNDLGLCYLGKNRLDLAVQHLEKAVKLKPSYGPAINNLGVVYLKQKNWQAAIDAFKTITGNLLYGAPQYPLSNLGEVYYNMGELEQAEYYYNEALKRKPNFVNALRGLGQTYVKMNRIQDAIYSFEKALKNAPNSAATHFDLAKAYQRIEDQEKSKYSYEKVIELAPDSNLARQAEYQLYKMTGRRY